MMTDEPQIVPAPDASGAAWLTEHLGRPTRRPEGSVSMPAGAIIPAGFEAYVRLFHPAVEIRTGRRLRWADVAARFGRKPHAEMQWHSVVGSQRLYSPRPDLFQDPGTGQLPLPETRALVDILTNHTRNPESCWFAIWEGWGTPLPLRAGGARPPDHERAQPPGPEGAHSSGVQSPGADGPKWHEQWPFCDAATLTLPGRSYYLLRGSIQAALSLARWQGASLWWPDDRTWCVATEVDFMWTYVAGSHECIDQILADERLETRPAALTDRADAGGDRVNGH